MNKLHPETKHPRPRLRTLDADSLRQVAGGDPKPPVLKILECPPPVILK